MFGANHREIEELECTEGREKSGKDSWRVKNGRRVQQERKINSKEGQRRMEQREEGFEETEIHETR